MNSFRIRINRGINIRVRRMRPIVFVKVNTSFQSSTYKNHSSMPTASYTQIEIGRSELNLRGKKKLILFCYFAH